MSTLLRVSEIFYSLQGEADTVGWPTVFIRLTGCPLRCSWCDTSYAFNGGEKLTLDAILSETAQYGTRHVCVTGGEPLAQAGSLALLSALAEIGYHVSLETSGAFGLAGVDKRVSKVMDLKAPGSGETERNLWTNLAHLTPRDQIKIVIADDGDYQWAKQQIHAHALHQRCTVLLSPAASLYEPVRLAEQILQDRLQARMQVQLHKLLWGNTPGK